MTTTFSFPGLGIGEHTIEKVAFTMFGRDVRWYGLIITAGIILAFCYAVFRGQRNEGVAPDDVIDIGIWTVLLGVIGARVYYVLTELDQYDSFYEMIAIWNGGIAIYGAIIGGCLGIVLTCLFKKISWRKLFDMAAPGVILAQAVGRWGNFCNGEAHGYAIGETTTFDLFTHVFHPASGEGTFFHWIRMGLTDAFGTVYYHPTFLYESVWNLLGFLLINLFYKHKRFDGQVALLYFTWYGFGRMWIEGLRTDSLYITGTSLRISQCVGLLCFVVGLVLLLVFSFRKKRTEDAPTDGTATTDVSTKEETLWERLFLHHAGCEKKKDETEDGQNGDEN